MLTKNGAILGCKREKVMQSLSCYFCYYTRHINLVRGIKHNHNYTDSSCFMQNTRSHMLHVSTNYG